MKVRYLIVFFLLITPTVALATEIPDCSLEVSGFFCGAYDFSETENDTGVVVEDNSFQVGKARLNLDFRTAEYPLLIHFKGDMETGSFVSKELYLEAGLYKTNSVCAQFQAGLVSSPCIGIHPPPEVLETYNYPLTAPYCTFEEIGVRFDLNIHQFEFKAALLNGNRREPRDDDRDKNFQFLLGWHPSWGMVRAFYMCETDGTNSLYGVRSEVRLPWEMNIRASAAQRKGDDEDVPAERWGWNFLVVQNLDRFQLRAMYEQIDEDFVDLDYVDRLTFGAGVTFWENVSFGVDWWENLTGPKDWGIGVMMGFQVDPIKIWQN